LKIHISVDIIKINRLDRFDKDMIIKSCLKTKRVFICEESVQAGSIGVAISSLLSEANCLAITKFINIGETFGEIGTVYETYINHGLDSKDLASCVIDTINAESRSNNE
jgi:transketolase